MKFSIKISLKEFWFSSKERNSKCNSCSYHNSYVATWHRITAVILSIKNVNNKNNFQVIASLIKMMFCKITAQTPQSTKGATAFPPYLSPQHSIHSSESLARLVLTKPLDASASSVCNPHSHTFLRDLQQHWEISSQPALQSFKERDPQLLLVYEPQFICLM